MRRMVKAVGLLLVLLLGGCAAVDGEPVPGGGSGPVTAQVDVQLRPVLEERPDGRAEPPDVLVDGDGVAYRLGPAVGDLTRFEEVRAEVGQHGGWVVHLQLGAEDAAEFAGWTAANVGERLAVVVDGAVVTAPVIQDAIIGGAVQITGDFTRDDATAIVEAITGR